MQEIANRELTPEQIEAFEKEQRKFNQQLHRDEFGGGTTKRRKSKGEKKRAKRDRRKYGYA